MDSELSRDHVESSNHTKRGKPRRTRSKFSSVSSRLDPKFDLRVLLNPKDEETKPENVELNPRTMEFEKLVSLLGPAFILEYLQKILNFLTSSMTKLGFQNIALYKEILLVRLCQEKSNLNCATFCEEARKVARQIMDVVKANQNVYEWICKYERGIFCPDVLVYEKVYYTSGNLRITISNGSKVIGPPLRPKRSSNADGDSNTKDLQITPADKAHMLNTLLKFIKDNTQLQLVYPYIHNSQVNLLTSLISQGKVDTDVGFGCKSLYAPLCEALTSYKKVYDFSIQFEEDSSETVLMILKKILKPIKIKSQSPKQNSHGDHKNKISNAPDKSQNTEPNKSSKHMTKLNLIGAVEESFIKASLREVLDFMEDDSRASLDFTKLTKEECGYLSRTLQYSREPRCHDQFTAPCRALLKRIDAASKNPNWKLLIEVGKKDRATLLQTISMLKEPYSRESTKPTERVVPQSHAAKAPDITPRRKKTPAKAKPISFQSAGPTDMDTDKDAVDAMDKTTEKPMDDVARLVAKSSRKSKLLAAMSVPLECDKGERMMRLMGWRGGALGLRGEGITEPIIPPLHLAPGAGLGHIKHVQTTLTMSEFRYQFLNSILSFLRAEESETTLEYTESLMSRKKRSVNHIMQCLKQGVDCGLKRSDEKLLLKEVVEEMQKQGKQVEGSVSSPDDNKITLKKAPLTARKVVKLKRCKKDTGSNSKNPDSTANNPDSTTNNPDSTSNNPNSTPNYPDSALLYNILYKQNTSVVQNTDSDGCITETITENQIVALTEHFYVESITKTSKKAQDLAYKVISLTKIHDFLQIGDEKRRYMFVSTEDDQKHMMKIKSYISTVIMNVNRKVKQNFVSELESVIYGDIRKSVTPGCCLSVAFEDQSFTLQKKVYQKRFTNSARELPPPKSTDLKNTIIYQNNKIVSCNGVINTDDDDDDDVTMEEKKIDVFEISDDEDNEMEVYSETISISETENSEKTEEKLTDVIIEDSLNGSLISVENLSTSRETLLLEPLEDDIKVKTIIINTELDNDIQELERAIIDCDLIHDEQAVQIFDVKQELDTSENNCEDLSLETLEINNNDNLLIAKNEPDLLVSNCIQTKDESVDTADCNINEKHTTAKNLDLLQTVIGESVDTEDCKINVKHTTEKNLDLLQTTIDTDDKITEIRNDNNGESNTILAFTDEYNGEKTSTNKQSLLSTENDPSYTDCLFSKEKATELRHSNENRDATPMYKENSTEILDSVKKSKDKTYFIAAETDLCVDFKDRSPGNSKRSRSASITSEPESLCKKCKSQIRNVRITCKESNEVLTLDIIRKVQSVISESIDIIIDNVDFLPRLEYNGVKNGGLIYSCHDDQTFAWLTNFVATDLDLNITETDYYPSKTYKMEINIHSLEGVDKILSRLELYNPEINTSLWRVIDKKQFEDFVIITVEIDRESFEHVIKNSNSLFAGVDKAKFNIVWG